MITYVYEREDGTRFEKRQSIKDDGLKVCPDTGLLCKRIIQTNTLVHFKGGGWANKEHKEWKREIEAKKDPLYTTLPDYQEDVDRFKDENEISDNKIRVTV